jgi:hypothetical protein
MDPIEAFREALRARLLLHMRQRRNWRIYDTYLAPARSLS